MFITYRKKIIIELNVEHTPKTALTLVALPRDVRLPSSVNARVWQSNYSNYSHRANKLTQQPIRTTTRFSGSDVTGQHYRPVPSDVSLPRLSERRRRLKFRLQCTLFFANFDVCLIFFMIFFDKYFFICTVFL